MTKDKKFLLLTLDPRYSVPCGVLAFILYFVSLYEEGQFYTAWIKCFILKFHVHDFPPSFVPVQVTPVDAFKLSLL